MFLSKIQRLVFMMHVNITLEDLVKAGAHFGHQARKWNPKMAPYLYGVRDGVHIFDLTKTKTKIEEALDFLAKSYKEGKSILFVGTKKQAQDKVFEVAKATGSFYITKRWLGGTFTNFEQIRRSSKRLVDLKSRLTKGEFKYHTKKERLLIEKEIARLEKTLGGLVGIESLPDIVFIVDTRKESCAVKEAKEVGRVIVGIVDSNANPDDCDYVIPMNDDSTRSLEYILEKVKEALVGGKEVKSEKERSTKIHSSKKQTGNSKEHDDPTYE
ncbi:MAG: 30S ribosomal protein S2 [Patescibacteria group bacterium]|nr:30S ribosomal protein S2 [Patescibacteria group bacterium]